MASHFWFLQRMMAPASFSTSRDKVTGEGVNLTEINKNLVREALQKTAGSKTRAAKLPGIARSSLISRLKKS